MRNRNANVVDFNSVLTASTNSHSAAYHSGKLSVQSKSALFYISPYVAKNKVGLTTCLSMFEKAMGRCKEAS